MLPMGGLDPTMTHRESGDSPDVVGGDSESVKRLHVLAAPRADEAECIRRWLAHGMAGLWMEYRGVRQQPELA